VKHQLEPPSFFKSASLAALLAAALNANQAAAQPLRGYWLGPDRNSSEMALSFIMPEYSPNEFAVIAMHCSPSEHTIKVYLDTYDETRPKQPSIPLLLDGKRFNLPGKSEWNEMNETWLVEATVSYGSPAAVALRAARQIGVDGDPKTRSLPKDRLATALNIWLQRCKL